MNKSFSARLAALEALEVEQSDRVLCVFLHIRPAEYAALCGADASEAARVFVAYGLDQIADGERVNVWGGTWPNQYLPPNDLTIYHQFDAAGYGSRVDAWPTYTDAPSAGCMALVGSKGGLMNKSFTQRLAALEALEATAEQDREPLTDEDRQMLSGQLSIGNIALDASGRAVRSWTTGSADYTADLDRAISRLNLELTGLVPRLHTTEALDAWLLDLPDPDTFDDDELLAEAFYGWVARDKWSPLLHYRDGRLVATMSSGATGRWWARIAERAGVLLASHGMVILPLMPEDVRAALDLLDSGVMRCRPLYPHCWKSHHTSVTVPHNGGIVNAYHNLHSRLAHALDELAHQTSSGILESAEDVRAVLAAALE